MDLIVNLPSVTLPDRFNAIKLGTDGMRRMVMLCHPIEYKDKSYIGVCGSAWKDSSNIGVVIGQPDSQYVFIPFANIGMIYECNKVIKDPNVLILDAKTYADKHVI